MKKLSDPIVFDNRTIMWDYKLRWEQSVRLYYHWHQCCEFLFVHEGQGTIILDNHTYNIKRGMFFFFKPFQLHHVNPDPSPNHPYIRSLIHIDQFLIEELIRNFPKRHKLFNRLWHQDSDLNVIDFSARIHELERIYGDFNRLGVSEREDTEELAYFFMQLLSNIIIVESHYADTHTLIANNRITRYSEEIMNYIDLHFGENVTLEQLSKTTHLSTSYLSRLFRRETGSNITDYLTARRIREACLLLKTTDLTVEQIGIKVGLANASYFNQIFKSSIGTTPLKYRNVYI